jgi:2,6-dihydroxypseudooxynicotine hydrolase
VLAGKGSTESGLSDEILARVWAANATRLLGDGVPGGDVNRARASLERWEQWFPYWTGRGEAYEALAREALAKGRRRSGGELLWQACLSHHYAQFLWFHDPANREAGQKRKAALYREAAPLLEPPAERFDIAFDGFTIPGYLRVPRAQGRVPVVMVLGGLESTKEESYLFENRCLARGLATCTFDGPGQGEMFFQTKLRPDFHRFASAVVDWLEKRRELDTGRLGVIGRSLGGYYAVHSAAHDERFRICIAWGVLFDLSYYPTMKPPSAAGFSYVAGGADPRELVNLAGTAERVRVPVYALHGAQDALIPPSQVEKLRAALKGNPDVTFDMPADGDHCCHNLYHVVRPRMADWAAERLGGRL